MKKNDLLVYYDKMQSALQTNKTILLGVECSVNYSGRAETFLPRGERVIMIKSDNTLLIHQPQGRNPINYMRDNTSHRVDVEGSKLVLKSQNLPAKEFIDVAIDKIHFLQTASLRDGQKIQLSGNEKDMADMLAGNLDIVEKGLRLVSQEEQTKYGFIDLLCFDQEYNLVVIECKRYKADFNAVQQLRRYVEKVSVSKGVKQEAVRGILVSPDITPNALKMLTDLGCKHAKVNPPKYKERFNKSQMSLGDY
jgi:endonuclease